MVIQVGNKPDTQERVGAFGGKSVVLAVTAKCSRTHCAGVASVDHHGLVPAILTSTPSQDWTK
jgi:hypothetical protein